jgi:histidine ammonia-lyase
MTRPAHRVLGVERLTIRDIATMSAEGTTVELAPACDAAIQRSREIVAASLEADTPVYGLTTGLGGNLEYRVPASEIAAFQVQIVRGRMIGLGDPLPRNICRSALLCRLVELASGRTGVSSAPIATLVAMFNRGVTPVVPRFGSLGASDIGLVAHLVSVAIGMGEAWVGERRLPGAEALAAVGLAPAKLEAKDGLGLISHGSLTNAAAALALVAIDDLLAEQAAIAALSFEGFRANPTIFDPRLHAARPAAGQVDAAATMRRLLSGSYLHAPGAPAKIQDALCFREIAPILGTAMAACNHAIAELEVEINGITCSPLVLLDEGKMLSSPNFHPSSLALAMDALAIALAHTAWATALRICKLMTNQFSGLPKYLSPVGNGSAGYVSLQKTTAALYADIRSRTFPAMLDVLPVSDSVEDMSPLAFLAVRKLEEQLPALRYLGAIEAVAAAQAVDLRNVAERLAPATKHVHRAVRDKVPTLASDREPGLDVEAARTALDDPNLGSVLRGFRSDALSGSKSAGG